MNLKDLVHFVLDQASAAEGQDKGNIRNTIDEVCERFGITKQLKQIILNTIEWLETIKDAK